MGNDFEVWSVQAPLNGDALPHASGWSPTNGGWRYSKTGWQIVIDQPIVVDDVDIPPEIGLRLVGASFLTRVSLEPIHAPKSAHAFLRQVVRAMTRVSYAVALDLQTREILGESGRPRFSSPAKDELIEVLAMNWWFTEGPLTTREGARELLRYLQNNLPEFLPRRYGDFEPPQFRFDASNIDSFLEFLFTRRLINVFHAQGKFFEIIYEPTRGPGWVVLPGRGFRFDVPRLKLSCPLRTLDQPGSEVAIRKCWRTISLLAGPFYGDVRILGGYVTRGNSLLRTNRTEGHPIGGPWRGLPTTLGVAVVLGEPYLSLWPDFKGRAEVRDGLAFQSLPTWGVRGEVSEITGRPADSLCQQGKAPWLIDRAGMDGDGSGGGRGYAYTWPFAEAPVSNSPV